VKLVFGEHYRRVAGPKNLDFIQKISKGWSYFLQFTPESNAQARKMYEEAIQLEPEAATPYNMLGWTYLFDVFFGSSKSPDKDMEKAFELAQKAITLDDSLGSPHSLLGYIYLANQQYEKAVAQVEQAVALSPNDADARAHMANIFNYVGRREESIKLSKQAIRLNPFPQPYYFSFLGEALCLAGQYEKAIKAYRKVLHLNPNDAFSKAGLAVAYSLLGREEEARAMAAEFLLMRPSFSVKYWTMGVPYKNRADITLFADTMRKVGIPD
jgi:adenylate cyclase